MRGLPCIHYTNNLGRNIESVCSLSCRSGVAVRRSTCSAAADNVDDTGQQRVAVTADNDANGWAAGTATAMASVATVATVTAITAGTIYFVTRSPPDNVDGTLNISD